MLKELDLSRNEQLLIGSQFLKREVLVELQAAVPSSCKITPLAFQEEEALDWSGKGADAVRELVTYLEDGSDSLRRLNLSNCKMTDSSVSALAASCKGLRVLKELDLSGNDDLTKVVVIKAGVESTWVKEGWFCFAQWAGC
eukprot:COSAG02_NODE_7432_length_3015_cov_6.358025_4_plen_141_part_00